MRFDLATISSVILIVGMFVFRSIMSSKLLVWEQQSLALSGFQRLLARAALCVSAYWLVLVPVILIACFLVALIWPRSDKGEL